MKNYFIFVQIKTFFLTSNIIIKIIKSPITPVMSNKLQVWGSERTDLSSQRCSGALHSTPYLNISNQYI